MGGNQDLDEDILTHIIGLTDSVADQFNWANDWNNTGDEDQDAIRGVWVDFDRGGYTMTALDDVDDLRVVRDPEPAVVQTIVEYHSRMKEQYGRAKAHLEEEAADAAAAAQGGGFRKKKSKKRKSKKRRTQKKEKSKRSKRSKHSKRLKRSKRR